MKPCIDYCDRGGGGVQHAYAPGRLDTQAPIQSTGHLGAVGPIHSRQAACVRTSENSAFCIVICPPDPLQLRALVLNAYLHGVQLPIDICGANVPLDLVCPGTYVPGVDMPREEWFDCGRKTLLFGRRATGSDGYLC